MNEANILEHLDSSELVAFSFFSELHASLIARRKKSSIKLDKDDPIKCYLKRNKKVCFVKRTEVIKCTFTRDIYKDYCCALALSLEAKNAPPYVHPGTFDEFNARVEKETTTNVDNKFTVFENELLENSPELVQVLKEQSFNVETGKDRFAVNCLVELVNVDARFVADDFDVDNVGRAVEAAVKAEAKRKKKKKSKWVGEMLPSFLGSKWHEDEEEEEDEKKSSR